MRLSEWLAVKSKWTRLSSVARRDSCTRTSAASASPKLAPKTKLLSWAFSNAAGRSASALFRIGGSTLSRLKSVTTSPLAARFTPTRCSPIRDSTRISFTKSLTTPNVTWTGKSTPTVSKTSGVSLKRGLKGTYISTEPFHLFRYLDEQAFRYNHRATKEHFVGDGDRFDRVVRQIVGKRLTWNKLTGKTPNLEICRN
jgi:hypothetical protein